MLKSYKLYNYPLDTLINTSTSSSRVLFITTINAHSYNMTRKDPEFAEALKASDVLLPDGISIVWAKRFLSTGGGKQRTGSSKRQAEHRH